MAAQGQVLTPPVPALATYDDLVRAAKAVMNGRSPEAQAELVRGALHGLLPKDTVRTYRSVRAGGRGRQLHGHGEKHMLHCHAS